MNLTQLAETLDRMFVAATPAGRLSSVEEPRLYAGMRQPKTASETRWYAWPGSLAECVFKWERAGQTAASEATWLCVTALGWPNHIVDAAMAELRQASDKRAAQANGKSACPMGDTDVVLRNETMPDADAQLDTARFGRLAAVLSESGHHYDEVTRAIELLAEECSERVIDVFLRNRSFVALERLSKWGVVGAARPLEELSVQLESRGDVLLGRALVATHRLAAWKISAQLPDPV